MADARSEIVNELDSHLRASKRRDFLKLAAMGGLGVFLPAVITACNDDPLSPTAAAGFSFGTDRGALNLAYAYAQFMADFYTRVLSSPFVGMTNNENAYITEINGHKGTQRNTLQNLITSGRITDALLFNFNSVDFSQRPAVMDLAQTFEDLGVAAINGSATTVNDATNLTLLGKIGSVWGRHAAVIRDLNNIAAGEPRIGFAESPKDPATAPDAVAQAIQPYFRTSLSTSGV
jgi:hypothetical protein